MSSIRCSIAVVSMLTVLIASPAAAGGWDLIYADRFDLTLSPNGLGISLGVNSFGLIVNTSSDPLPLGTVFTNTFVETSSRPDITLHLSLDELGNDLGGPLQPNEAMGNVSALNQLFVDELLPTEALRNTAPLQFFFFQISTSPGVEGPVSFDVVWTMNGYQAAFTISGEVRRGTSGFSFPSAARVTAVPIATAARPTTWGRLKQLYR